MWVGIFSGSIKIINRDKWEIKHAFCNQDYYKRILRASYLWKRLVSVGIFSSCFVLLFFVTCIG